MENIAEFGARHGVSLAVSQLAIHETLFQESPCASGREKILR
jgi:hypothetical protein